MSEVQSSSPTSQPGQSSLFRKQSLEQLERPEDYHVPLRVVGRVEWLAGLLCLSLCVAAVLWACFARYRETVEGPGVLVRSGGVFIGINAPKAGWIDGLVTTGERVDADQLVASLTTPEEDARVDDLIRRIDQIELQRLAITQRYEMRIASETQAQQRRREQLEESAGLTRRRIAEAETTLSQREYLVSQGSGTVDRVQEARERFFSAREQLSRTQAELAALDSAIHAIGGQRDQELEANQRQLLDLRGQLEQARLSRKLADEIRAPRAGIVALVPVTMNALVAAGQRIVTLETGGNRLEALFFVPGDMGKRIQPGMEVRLSPTTAPREEYGMILGTVVSVSPHPEGQAEITERLGNPELARLMAQNGTPFEVRATLTLNPDSPNGYVWTSERGKEISLSSGLLLTANVTVRRAPPITLVIPALRRWTGL
jgi:NHLM bacteriocin system secretion protein